MWGGYIGTGEVQVRVGRRVCMKLLPLLPRREREWGGRGGFGCGSDCFGIGFRMRIYYFGFGFVALITILPFSYQEKRLTKIFLGVITEFRGLINSFIDSNKKQLQETKCYSN